MKKGFKPYILVLTCTFVCISPSYGQNLKRYINQVLANNPQVQSARASVEAENAQVSQALGNFFPSLDVDVIRGNEHTQIGTSEDTLWTRENSISVTQDVFRGGENFYTYRRNKYQRQAAVARLHEVTQQVALQAITAYTNVLRNRQLVKKAIDNVINHQRVLDDMILRLKHKAGRRGEVQLALARLSLAQSRLDQFWNQLNQARYNYQQASGYLPPRSMELIHAPERYMPTSFHKALMIALENNPNIHNTEHQLKARRASQKIERSRFLPKFSLRGRTDFRDNINGIKGRNNSYVYEVDMQYNLFNGGSDWASWNNAAAQTTQAMHNVDNAQREITKSVSTSWSAIKTSLRRINHFKTYVRSTRRVSKDYQLQFQVGRRPLFNVLDAERENFRARVSYINSRYNYLVRTYRLLADTGQLLMVLNEQFGNNE